MRQRILFGLLHLPPALLGASEARCLDKYSLAMSRPPGHDARDSITASCHGDSSQLSAVKWRDPFSLDGHPLATMPQAKDRTAILALLTDICTAQALSGVRWMLDAFDFCFFVRRS